MLIRHGFLGVMATAMAVTAPIAHTQSARSSADKLSVQDAHGIRTATAGRKGSKLGGGALLPVLFIVVAVVSVSLATDDDPDSP
jgi:hypothetical protein